MPTVQADLPKDALTWSKDGLKATRVFKVSGVEGTNAAAHIGIALTAEGIPKRGQAHPGITGLFADSISAKPDDLGIFEVTVEYVIPDPGKGSGDTPDESKPPRISLGGSMQSTTTNEDIRDKGKPIRLSHTFIYKGDDGKEVKRTVVKDQTVEIDVQVPVLVLRFERRETAMPIEKKIAFQGKVNSGEIWNGAAREWLCTDISADSDDGGLTYNVVYEFQRIPGRTWDPTVICVDTETGQLAIDPKPDVGIKTVQVYEQAEFSELNLSYDQRPTPTITNQIGIVGG